jgi:hypothetical protein
MANKYAVLTLIGATQAVVTPGPLKDTTKFPKFATEVVPSTGNSGADAANNVLIAWMTANTKYQGLYRAYRNDLVAFFTQTLPALPSAATSIAAASTAAPVAAPATGTRSFWE